MKKRNSTSEKKEKKQAYQKIDKSIKYDDPIQVHLSKIEEPERNNNVPMIML